MLLQNNIALMAMNVLRSISNNFGTKKFYVELFEFTTMAHKPFE